MFWTAIILLWIAFSIVVPIFFGQRYTQFKRYREQLERARTRFHRFHVFHRLLHEFR